MQTRRAWMRVEYSLIRRACSQSWCVSPSCQVCPWALPESPGRNRLQASDHAAAALIPDLTPVRRQGLPLPLRVTPLPSCLRHCLCIVFPPAFAAKTPPLPCGLSGRAAGRGCARPAALSQNVDCPSKWPESLHAVMHSGPAFRPTSRQESPRIHELVPVFTSGFVLLVSFWHANQAGRSWPLQMRAGDFLELYGPECPNDRLLGCR